VETLPAGRADWPFDCWLSEAVFGQQLAAGGTGHLFSLLVFLWRACQTHGCGVPARASHTHLSAAPQTPDGKTRSRAVIDFRYRARFGYRGTYHHIWVMASSISLWHTHSSRYKTLIGQFAHKGT